MGQRYFTMRVNIYGSSVQNGRPFKKKLIKHTRVAIDVIETCIKVTEQLWALKPK